MAFIIYVVIQLIPYNGTVSEDIIFAAAFLFTVTLGTALPFGYLSSQWAIISFYS